MNASRMFAFCAAALPLVAAASPGTDAIDATAKPLAAMAAAHKPSLLFANFKDGRHYVAFASQAAYDKAFAAFMNGPGAGGGAYVAHVYRDAKGNRYVTFDPATHASMSESETALYDPAGRLIRLRATRKDYSGDYAVYERDAYFDTKGATLSDTTTATTYAPSDTTFTHPLSHHTAAAEELDLPVYTTIAKLPFPV